MYDGPIDHGTHVTVPVSQSSAESDYNASYTAGMALSHFRILIHKLLNKDPDIVPEEAPMIILCSKSAMCMDNNGKDTKHTRHIARRMNFVRNGQDCPDNGRSTGAYIIFDQGGPIYHGTLFQDQFLNQVHKVSIM